MSIYWLAYVLIAVGLSVYRGIFAFQIHNIPVNEKWSRHFKFNQFLLNFLATMVGFVALAYFVARHHPEILSGLREVDIDYRDFVALLVAFLGISGYLPYAVLAGKLPKSPHRRSPLGLQSSVVWPKQASLVAKYQDTGPVQRNSLARRVNPRQPLGTGGPPRRGRRPS